MWVQLEEAQHAAEVAAAEELRRSGLAHLTAQKAAKLQLRRVQDNLEASHVLHCITTMTARAFD